MYCYSHESICTAVPHYDFIVISMLNILLSICLPQRDRGEPWEHEFWPVVEIRAEKQIASLFKKIENEL